MATLKAAISTFVIACVVIVAIIGFSLKANTVLSSKTLHKKTMKPDADEYLGSIYRRIEETPAKVAPGPATAGAKVHTLKPTSTPARKPTAAPTSPKINPGCIERTVGAYKPVNMGIKYHHPSLIQYAKLSKDKTATSVSLTFMEYMALVSAYKFLKPEKIMIHTYTDIKGKYWDIVQKWKTPVVANKVERVMRLNGRKLAFISHHADFIKIRGLLEFGGTISDFDVIIVNGTRWKEMQKTAECVLSQQIDIINAGFNSCIRNSTFVRRWLKGYYTDYQSNWLHNASYKPKYILEDKKSTAPCYNMHVVDNIATRPMWSKYKEWLKVDGVQWREKVAAHYFNQDMKAYNESSVHANNSFGELLRYVQEAS